MDAAGDEQYIQTLRPRPGDVRAKPVADGERPGRRAAERRRACRERGFVYRRVRFAGVDDFAAELRVTLRQRAGAIDEIGAAMNDDVRVGADEWQSTRRQRRQAGA